MVESLSDSKYKILKVSLSILYVDYNRTSASRQIIGMFFKLRNLLVYPFPCPLEFDITIHYGDENG